MSRWYMSYASAAHQGRRRSRAGCGPTMVAVRRGGRQSGLQVRDPLLAAHGRWDVACPDRCASSPGPGSSGGIVVTGWHLPRWTRSSLGTETGTMGPGSRMDRGWACLRPGHLVDKTVAGMGRGPIVLLPGGATERTGSRTRELAPADEVIGLDEVHPGASRVRLLSSLGLAAWLYALAVQTRPLCLVRPSPPLISRPWTLRCDGCSSASGPCGPAGDPSDVSTVAAAMLELAADHDYLVPRIRHIGDWSGSSDSMSRRAVLA